MPEADVREKFWGWFGLAVLVAGTAASYWRGLAGAFILDDFPNLVLAQDWKLTGWDPAQIGRVVWGGIAGVSGRPLAMLSFGLNYLYAGLDPFWMKAGNLSLHLVNALLVWRLSGVLLALAATKEGAAKRWAPWVIAAIWALHPLQVSTVLYVVQRMEIGAATGVLLALLFYISLRKRQQRGARAWPWALGCGLSVLFGLGFKETAALAPGYAFLIEIAIFQFATVRGRTSRFLIAGYVLLAVFALAAFARLAWPLHDFDLSHSARDFTPGQRLLTQGPILAMYLGQILLPLPSTLHFYYDNFPVSTGLLSPPATLFSWLVLMALIVAAISVRRSRPLVFLGIGWFLMGHLLTSSPLMLELAFEHRNYLPMLGILLALADICRICIARFHSDARITLSLVVIVGFAALTSVQAATWGDAVRLDWTLENRNPTSPRATYQLGMRLAVLANGDPQSPQWSMARAEMLASSRLPNASPLALQGVLQLDGRAGKPIPVQLWSQWGDQLTRKVMTADASTSLYALTQCRIELHCKFDDRQLLEVYLKVLARNPDNPEVMAQYANFAWNVLRDRPLAIRVQQKVVDLAPSARNRLGLAKFLLAFGDEAQGCLLETELRQHSGDVTPEELRQLKSLGRCLN